MVFVRDRELILYSNDKEDVPEKEVDGMAVNENVITYWKGKKVFLLDEEYNSILIYDGDYPIERVILDISSTEGLLVISKPDAVNYQFILLLAEPNLSYKQVNLYQLSSVTGETVSNFYFAFDGSKLNIIYTTFITKQGTVTYHNYFTEMNLNLLDMEPKFEKMKIYEDISNNSLDNPRHMKLLIEDNKTTLVFSASGYISAKEKAVNIYEAKYNDGKWIAEKRSKTRETSIYPAWLNEKTMVWLDYSSNKEYQLKASSTKSSVIEESQHINADDISYAISNTIVALATSLILLFNAMVWVLLPALFIIMVLIFNINLIEKNVFWVKIVGFILYLLAQFITHENSFNHNFSLNAPKILNFPYNYIIVPLVLAGISYMYTSYIRSEDWDSIKEVTAFVGINVLMYILLLGPYII